MIGRGIRLTRRNGEALLMSAVLPMMLMLVFVFLFGGAIQTSFAAYVDFVVPGVLVMCIGFVSALTAVGVAQDMHQGIVDRFRATDVSGVAVVCGHVVAGLARTGVAVGLLVAVALLIGFRPAATPLQWIATLGLLLLFALAVAAAAAVFGLIARSPEGAGAFQFIVMFLPYPSSGFVPIESMPGWLQGFARHQPLTSVIDSARGLLTGMPVGDRPLVAIAWCVGILVGSTLLAGFRYQRRTSAG